MSEFAEEGDWVLQNGMDTMERKPRYGSIHTGVEDPEMDSKKIYSIYSLFVPQQ